MNNSGKLFCSINDDITMLVDIILQLNDNGQLDQFILDNVKNIASTSFFCRYYGGYALCPRSKTLFGICFYVS